MIKFIEEYDAALFPYFIAILMEKAFKVIYILPSSIIVLW